MARSYGSYYRERDKDKPYRTAEIALGFLGDLIAQKNQQSLDYQKLALQEEATQATKEYREDTLASKTINLPTGQVMGYNPETNRYDIQIAGQGAGVQNWGQTYGDQFFNKYLDGNIEWEDTDKDGVLGSKGDRPWVGPSAQLWRDYKTAKTNNEPDFELKHPQTIVDGYKDYTGTDANKMQEITSFLDNMKGYQNKLSVYNDLLNMPVTSKESEVRNYVEKAEEQFKPPKLAKQDLIGIQTQLNRRSKLKAYLEGSTEVVVYSGADEDWGAPVGGGADPSNLSQTRQTIKQVQITPEKKAGWLKEIQGIERFLDEMDIPYSKTIATDDPLNIFD